MWPCYKTTFADEVVSQKYAEVTGGISGGLPERGLAHLKGILFVLPHFLLFLSRRRAGSHLGRLSELEDGGHSLRMAEQKEDFGIVKPPEQPATA